MLRVFELTAGRVQVIGLLGGVLGAVLIDHVLGPTFIVLGATLIVLPCWDPRQRSEAH